MQDAFTLPDDPAAVRAAAGHARTVASQADTWDEHVGTAVSATWKGSAADSYDASRQTVQHRWASVAPAMNATAGALDSYASTLENSRSRLTDLAASYDTAAKVQTTIGAQVGPVSPSQQAQLDRAGSDMRSATGQAWAVQDQIRSAASQAAGTVRAQAAVAPTAAVVKAPSGIPPGAYSYGPGNGFPIPRSSAELAALLAAARAMGMDPKQYAQLLNSYYQALALEHAGIDLATWDPSKGADANKDIIEKVYTYYGKLFLDNPYMEWAGMANMIGPTFAGGFFDIHMIRQLAEAASAGTGNLPGWARAALPPPLNSIAELAHASDSELQYFENTFLAMQQKIFMDQAPMHEAYLVGGVDAIREMQAAGLIGPDMTKAWQQIDEGRATGDTDLLDAGNKALLYREQHDIIAQQYDDMEHHDPPIGEAFTYAMSTIGSSSIPGTESLAQHDPFSFTVDPPGPGKATLTTPFPDGNVANFDDRWDLIEKDTLPKYLDLIHDHPDQARQIIESSVDGRIDDQRLLHQWDDILGRLAGGWGVSISL